MKTGMKVGLGAVALVGLAVGGVLWVTQAARPGVEDDFYTRYRAEGMPLEVADLYTSPAPLEAKNAALDLEPLLDTITPSQELSQAVALASGTPAEQAKLAAALKPLEPTLNIAEKAASKPEFRLELDWSQGFNMPIPRLLSLNMLAQAFSGRAVLRAQNGQPDAAVTDIQRALQIGRFAGQEPILIGTLTQCAAQSTALEGARACLPYLSKEQVNRLNQIVNKAETPLSARDGLRGEVLLMASTMRGIRDAQHLEQLTQGSASLLAGSLTGPPEDAEVRKQFHRYLSYYHPVFAEEMTHQQITEHFQQVSQKMEGTTDPEDKLSKFTIPNLNNVGSSLLARESAFIGTRALIEARLFVFNNNRPVMTFNDITGTYIDPFSGKPMKFEANKGEVKFWSEGAPGNSPADKAKLVYILPAK